MDNFYLKECYESYKSTFPEGWLDSLDEQSGEELFEPLFEKIKQFSEKGFILFSKSAISGEYIQKEEVVDIITRFITAISPLEIDPNIDLDKESNLSKIKESIKGLNASLYNALRHYQALIEFAKDKFEPYSIENKYTSFRTKVNVSNLLDQFIEITFPLCRFDYQLPTNEDDFYKILHISTILNEINLKSNQYLKDVYSVLILKCNFIIKRIKIAPFEYSLDFSIENIDPERLDIGILAHFLPNSAFNDFDEKEFLEKIKSNEALDLKSYALLMWYYREKPIMRDDIKKMDFVIEKFEKLYSSKQSLPAYRTPQSLLEKCNKFALDSVYNFLYNCRFSFLSEFGELSLKDIRLKLRVIEDIQQKTAVNNFHPYKKAIEAIFKCIHKHLKTTSFEDRVIDDKIAELDRLIKKYEKALKWSRQHKFFPFQLTFEESISTSSVEFNIFTPSVYVNVIDYNKQIENLKIFKQQRELLDFHKELSNDRKKIEEHKNSIEAIKSNIERSEKKNYELIGLFTAVITFLFGAINIFTANDTSLSQIIVNTSGLGVVLLLFLVVFLFASPIFIQQIEIRKYIKTWRFALLSVFVISTIGVFVYFAQTVKQEQLNLDKANQEKSKTRDLSASITDKDSTHFKSTAIKKSNQTK
ncbi:MAG: hypothetical protein BGN96_09120 [Bacteroidales bacterium 45-6]|nr:MAG: hypothetical protein BGN96_09120 [Bacteroidales bacterium 45-6]